MMTGKVVHGRRRVLLREGGMALGLTVMIIVMIILFDNVPARQIISWSVFVYAGFRIVEYLRGRLRA